MKDKKIEAWRKKAINVLESLEDEDLKKAIRVLRDGKGYLTTTMPIRVIFYEDL